MGNRELTFEDGIGIVRHMEIAGMSPEEARLFSTNVAEEALATIRLRHYRETEAESKARAVLQDNFFGIPDVTKLLGVTFHHADLQEQTGVPDTSLFADYKPNRILTYGALVSISKLRSSFSHLFHPDCPKIENEHPSRRWKLVLRNLPTDFFSKPYADQVQYANFHNMEAMTAANTVYTAVLYHLRHGAFPFPTETSLRTVTVENDQRLMVTFTENGIMIESGDDGDLGRYIGLSVQVIA